ncbi:MAG TPA: RnfH family protein [Chromatiales bacterium]|nr:RnfH family protein [Chromatiales bacterium]
MADRLIEIEVACGLPDRQQAVPVTVPAGTVAREAVVKSGLQPEFPELDFERAPLAVFGKPVADDYRVQPAERVELCRPLQRDPRDARRELAAKGLTMGSGRRLGSDSVQTGSDPNRRAR